MRVLLAAKHAPEGIRRIGGVQTWSRTVAKELRKRGCEAITWGPEQSVPLGGFDLGIIANVSDTERAFALCRKAINVCHGIIPAEKPRAWDTVVYTSEEVRDFWHGDGPIIRQPIDLDFWSPFTTPALYVTRFSYRSGLRYLPTIALRHGYRYFHLRNRDEEGCLSVVRKSACVVATGRAALEAMACDIPVVIADHRSSYQGPLMDLDIKNAMTRNYSGRGGIVPTEENLSAAIGAAIDAGGARAHVRAHHDVVDIVDQLLELA